MAFRYRPEIDGLRTVAVIPVILFHAGAPGFEGGFVGVDVFFVISGYLITTILIQDLRDGTFSLARFYERRIRRILPALLTVILATAAVGWFWLVPHHLLELARSIAAVSVFASNILFWQTSGYFDVASDWRPLLHTWSLAVEEQYYLLYPPVVWLLWRWGRESLFAVFVLAAAASFVLAEWGVHHKPEATFYLLATRAWELLAGALVALHLHKRGAPYASGPIGLAGLALILWAVLAYDSRTTFPGAAALPPTLGAALFTLAAGDGSVARRLLAHPAPVSVGLISYSLYLWHLPLLVMARHVNSGPIPADETALLVLLSFGLAWLSWRYVEAPFRARERIGPRAVFAFAGIGTCAVAGFGVAGHVTKGMPGRFEGAAPFIAYFENSRPDWSYFMREGIPAKFRYDCDFFDLDAVRGGRWTTERRAEISESCRRRDPQRPHSVFVWGDSHAQMLRYGLSETLPDDWQILQVASSGCPADPAPDPEATDYCAHSNRFALDAIAAARPDVVVVGQFAGHDAARMSALAREVAARGGAFALFAGPAPRWTYDLPDLVLQKFWPETPDRTAIGLDRETLRLDGRLHRDFAVSETTAFVSLIDTLCDATGCLIRIGPDRLSGLTSFDDGHLTPAASRFVAERALAPAILAAADFARIRRDSP